MNAFCGVPLPAALRADIDRLTAGIAPSADDPPALAALGLQFTVSLCRDLLAGMGGGGGSGGAARGSAGGGGPRVLHLLTMNCEGAVAAVLRELGLSGPEAASRRKLPWRPSAVSSRAHEEMRPIFWANRPAAYVERTAHWTEFPTGRWKTARRSGSSSGSSGGVAALADAASGASWASGAEEEGGGAAMAAAPGGATSVAAANAT